MIVIYCALHFILSSTILSSDIHILCFSYAFHILYLSYTFRVIDTLFLVLVYLSYIFLFHILYCSYTFHVLYFHVLYCHCITVLCFSYHVFYTCHFLLGFMSANTLEADTGNYKGPKALYSLYETVVYKGPKALLSLYETMICI